MKYINSQSCNKSPQTAEDDGTGLFDSLQATHPRHNLDAAGARGARSLREVTERRSLAPRERSVSAGSDERSRPHPAEPPAGAPKGRRSRANAERRGRSLGSRGRGWGRRAGGGRRPDAGPGASLGVPEVALEAGRPRWRRRRASSRRGRCRSLRGHAGGGAGAGPRRRAHVLGDGASRPDALQEVDAGRARRHGPGDVRLGQADGGLDARRGRKAGKKGRLRRIRFARFVPRPSRRPHLRSVV